MASITEIFGTVEKDAGEVLHWLVGQEAKVAAAEPKVIAALGVVAGAVNKSITAVESAAAADGLNITLDAAVVADLKAAWPDTVAFLATLGIKV